MNITMKTEELQSVTAQLNKVKPNRLSPITEYWHIFGDGNEVSFVAYDGDDFLKVIIESKSEIDVMVNATQLSRLVDRTSTKNVTLKYNDGQLVFKGNGEYFIDVVSENEDYPTYDEYLPEDIGDMDPLKLKTSQFADIFNINSSAVSTTDADGIYTGYVLKDSSAITTDLVKVCISSSVDFGQELLLPAKLLQVLATLQDEDLYVWVFDTEAGDNESKPCILVTSASIELFGPLMSGLEDYADISSITESEFEQSVSIPTVNLLSAIDRLSIFIKSYDKGTVAVTFKNDGVKFESNITQDSRSEEFIKYSNVLGKDSKAKEYACILNSELLLDILKTIPEKEFTLSYGNESAIKIEANNAEYYLALQEDDE